MSWPGIRMLGRYNVNACVRGIATAALLAMAVPVMAAASDGQRKGVTEKRTQAAKPVRKAASQTTAPTASAPEQGRLNEAVPVPPPTIPPSAAALNETASVAAVPAVPKAGEANAASTANAAVPAENPYLAGWFRPTPVSELPKLAAQQLGANAQWAIQSVTTFPGKVAEALPSIKRVFPTGGRELWVANVKCPAEMVTGQYFFPANAVRDVVNGLLGTLNESQLLTFDIQLVCS